MIYCSIATLGREVQEKTGAGTHGARDDQGFRFGAGEGRGTESAKSCRSYDLRIDRLDHVKLEATLQEGKRYSARKASMGSTRAARSPGR